MESLEQKNANTGSEEPIKSEELVASPDNSERNSNLASPPPNCSICLGKLINTSFTDSCLHQFCFTCLLQWSKIKTECPLCKQTFKSIIHNVRSEEDYDQYNVQITQQVTATLDVAADIHDIHITGGGIAMWQSIANRNTLRPFMYRTTMGPGRRYGSLLNPHSVGRREQLPSYAPFISSQERRRRTTNSIEFRHSVYRHGTYSIMSRDIIGGTRECSPEYYRRNPSETDRLIPWLNRELQVLLNDNAPHISYVLNIIMDLITQYEIRSPEFRDRIRPYFGSRTSHFVHEFYNFASSNYDLIGYDRAVIYPQPNGLTYDYVPNIVSPAPSSSSSSSQDSDIRILGSGFNFYNPLPSGPYLFDLPGPSTLGQGFRMQSSSHIPDVLTISSTSSSSENECEVIGYVKPRHERTPEIIDLSSSEAEMTLNTENSTLNISNEDTKQENTIAPEEENHPSTSYDLIKRRTRRKAEQAKVQIYELLNSTSSGSDSEYDPSRRLRPIRLRRKTCSKKTKKTDEQKTRKKKKNTVSSKKNKVSDSDISDSENDERKRYQRNKKLIYENSKKNDKQKKSKRGRKRKSSVTVSKLRKNPSKRFKNNTSYSSYSSANSEDEQETSQRPNKNFGHYLSHESNEESENESFYESKRRSCKKNSRLTDTDSSSSNSSCHSNRSSQNNYNYESHNCDGSEDQPTSDQNSTLNTLNSSTGTLLSSSKSDLSLTQEHSNLNTNSVSKDKCRSHKKHKDSKRRRSYS